MTTPADEENTFFLNYKFDPIKGEKTEAFFAHQNEYFKSLPYYMVSLGIDCQGPAYYTNRHGMDELLILYTLQGCGKLNYQGGEYILKPRNLFVIDCRKQHYYATHGDQSWRFIWMHFGGYTAHSFYDFIFRNGFNIFTSETIDFKYIQSKYDELRSLVINRFTENDYTLCKVLHDIMISIAKLKTYTSPNKLPTPEWIVRTIEYINGQYNQDINPELLAKRYGYSKGYFTKQFKFYTGMSPYDYILSSRINHACTMLRDTDYTVEYISGAVNFSACCHFICKFKEIMKITPGEYRKVYR